MSRQVLTGANTKRMTAKKVLERERVKKSVVDFMERDNVSVTMPGRNNCKKTDV